MIKKYIQFGLDNWYEFKYNKNYYQKLDYSPDWIEEWKRYIGHINLSMNRVHNFKIEFILNKKMYANYYNTLEIITSKEFIEAVARWVYENNKDRSWNAYYQNIIKIITHEQAEAIRDNKLEEFITKLDLYENRN